MKKSLLILALTTGLINAAHAAPSVLNQYLHSQWQAGYLSGANLHFERANLFYNTFNLTEELFDNAPKNTKGVWGHLGYSKLKSQAIQFKAPQISFGYSHPITNDLTVGLTASLSQSTNDQVKWMSFAFQNKHNVLGLAINTHYQPSLGFIDASLGSWVSQNKLTVLNYDPFSPDKSHTPLSANRTQTGFALGARVGIEYPITEALIVTPSVQGTLGYATRYFDDTKAYHSTSIGAHLSGDWKVNSQFKIGANVGLDSLWSTVNTKQTNWTLGPFEADLVSWEKGLKRDLRMKAGLHANYNANQKLSFGIEAAYERYQKSKLHGMTFQLSGQYRF